MEMEDLEDMENFDIPLPSLGQNTKETEPSLPLLKNVSFGPSNEVKCESKIRKNNLNPPISMSKVVNNSFGGDKTLPRFGGDKFNVQPKGATIASFLQKNLKSSTLNSFSGISASALLSSNSLGSSSKNDNFTLTPQACKDENVKHDSSMEIDEFEEMDDMDFDNIPEPSLK